MPCAGARVRVPFGKRTLVGIVLKTADQSDVPLARLKQILEVLDPEPLLDATLLRLLLWAAAYYHHPVGEVIQSALPLGLRRGKPATVGQVDSWIANDRGRMLLASTSGRDTAEKRLLRFLADAPEAVDQSALALISKRWRAIVRSLVANGLVDVVSRKCLAQPPVEVVPPPSASTAQHQAITAIAAGGAAFHCYLLHGVTGSGKTEVYLQAIDRVIKEGAQALVLVPEIGLTPQFVDRFRRRFPVAVAVIHSALSESERQCAWLSAREGSAPIVLGTRSAVFVPLKALGLIVVDEEHDNSFKQQEGFRYSARDVAIVRAKREHVPIVLGSATPSLESLRNALDGRYQLLPLPERAGSAGLPSVRLLDLRQLARNNGLTPPLVDALRNRLERKEQSLLFINRRGFAPVLMCHDCGWIAACGRCDSRLTLHKSAERLRCHHCGSEAAIPATCPACHAQRLHGLGEGTERIESALTRLFPDARIERIDRDSTRRKGVLEEKLARVRSGDADIMVGTQMLAKGHDFPNLTLVGVVNADQGLYGCDFRSSEQLFQRLMQVAGRAGRADKSGEVIIQTFHPEHPLFSALRAHDYQGFANYALQERREAQFPPYTHLVLLRAESPERSSALRFLLQARDLAAALRPEESQVSILDPAPSPMERRAGRFRAQLLIQGRQRDALQHFLDQWLPQIAEMPQARKTRWSLDVDPMDLY